MLREEELATAVVGTYPTGMHSCLNIELNLKV